VSRELGKQSENAEAAPLDFDAEMSFEQRVLEIEKEMAARNSAGAETDAPNPDTPDADV
jgi:hypothetical protein